jgi:DNA-binding transcriptional ArsR family regulator
MVSNNLPLVETYELREFQFEALGEVTRRTLLEKLRHGPLAVGELAEGLPISRPAVSQHLKVLKQAHLVRDEAIGTRRYYRLDPQGFAALREYLNTFWDEALEAFQAKVEGE